MIARSTAVAVDAQGYMYVAGDTFSTTFSGFELDKYGGRDVLVIKLSPDGKAVPGGILAGTSSDDEVLRQDDFCYYDTFVTRFNPGGQTMAYSSYLNSNDTASLDFTNQVVADASGNATILGRTSGELCPVKDPIQATLAATPCISAFTRFCYDTFITTLSPSGALLFNSYLGGNDDEEPQDVFLRPNGSIYLTGSTDSANYPVVEGARQPNYSGGSDYFLARIGLPGGSTPNPNPQPNP